MTNADVSAAQDPRVIAIRGNHLVGRGTCSLVDECLSDGELLSEIDEATTPAEAVDEAIAMETAHLEQGLNARWGDDDDPQLATYSDWLNRLEAWRAGK